ncbi:MAG: exo-beta-N-acetylmuramidase NamZ domain-containing protein [Kiritimatiellia bacterium]
MQLIQESPEFRPGINVLAEKHADLLEGRRIGLVAHRASVDINGIPSAQLLNGKLDKGLRCIFGPEHGFTSTAMAGAAVKDGWHPEWKIPIHSLYGDTRKPTAEMLAGLDMIVVDLQDLAVRCYTYVSTLRLVMEAAAEYGLDVVVADRPVPFPNVCDGPMLDPAAESFVGMIPTPLVYGMTPAEAALFLKEQVIPNVSLYVIPMTGWRRDAGWPIFAPWNPPSPGILAWETAMIYPSLVCCEALPALDYGRGTPNIFKIVAASWIHAGKLKKMLGHLPGLETSVEKYTANWGRDAGTELEGLRFEVTSPENLCPAETAVRVLSAIQELHGASKLWADPETRPEFFDKLMGTSSVREALQAGTSASEIIAAWKTENSAFEALRKKVKIY